MALPVLNACLLAQTAPPPKQTWTYKTAGDCVLRADVYRKPGTDVRPAILWIHGGALIFGDRAGINSNQLARFLDAGFVVVSVDYRLAPETGLADILTDVQDAYRWIREKGPELYRIDPSRVAVLGKSAGGYLTLATGYRVSPRPRALVAFYGYGDIAGDWYSRPDPFYSRQPAVSKEEAWRTVGTTPVAGAPGESPRVRFYLYCRQQGLWPKLVAKLDPDTQPKAFDPFCPLRNVTPDYPPTMLLHGDQDTDVPFAQSKMMADELTRRGVQHQLITIPGGGHGFDQAMDDPRILQAFDQVLAFLKAHLQP